MKFLFLPFFLYSCVGNEMFINYQDHDVRINARINKIKVKEVDSAKVYFLHSNLNIKGVGNQLESVNLKCIELVVGEDKSKDIYIDSVAHILKENYKVNNNEVDIKVYWVFNNLEGEQEIHNLVANIVVNSKSCFKFSEKP